jgi:hypothetical protein
LRPVAAKPRHGAGVYREGARVSPPLEQAGAGDVDPEWERRGCGVRPGWVWAKLGKPASSTPQSSPSIYPVFAFEVRMKRFEDAPL